MCSRWFTASRAGNSVSPVPWVVTVAPVPTACARSVSPYFVTVASRNVTGSAAEVRIRKRTIAGIGSPASFGLM
jgi:hypothetical protein